MLTSRSTSSRNGINNNDILMDEKLSTSSSGSELPSPQSSTISLPIYNKKRKSKRPNPILSVLTLIGLSIILIVFYVSTVKLNGADSSECRSIYMFPSYARVVGFDSSHTKFASKYNLYLYREQGKDPFPYDENDEKEDIEHKNQKLIDSLNGIPVLFIPGNAGSYKQVRSIAAEAANIYFETQSHNDNSKRLDFYAAHFNEDFTAFHGRTMLDQAEYMNDAISFILSLYQNQPIPPTSVILIGHSMGGVVARVILTLPNYVEGSVNTIISLAAPHAAAPATFDGDIMRTYAATDRFWRAGFQNVTSNNTIAKERLQDVSLISITGGLPDTILPADYTTLRGLVPDSNGFTMFTSGIPSVWTPIDHLAIVWCDQLRKVIASTLYQIINPKSNSKTKPLDERMKIFRRNLLSGFEEGASKDYSSSINDTTLRLKLKREQIEKLDGLSSLTFTKTPKEISPRKFKLISLKSVNAPYFTFLSSLSPRQFNPDSKDSSILLCKQYKGFSGRQKNFVDLGLDYDDNEDAEKNDFECVDIFNDAYKVPNTLNPSSTLKDSSFGGSLSPFYAIQIPTEILQNYSYIIYRDSIASNIDDFTKISLISANSNKFRIDATLLKLLTGSTVKLPSEITSGLLNIDITVENAWSSLLSYKLSINYNATSSIFQPFIRQYINDPFETKWHLQLDEPKQISFHGIAPFTPFKSKNNPLHLELWNPKNENSEFEIKLKIDILRSLRLLILRYRLAVASFPIFIIVSTLLLQYNKFCSSGNFPPFKEGLNLLSKYFIQISIGLSLLSIISSNYLIRCLFYYLDPIGTTNPNELNDYHLNIYFLGLEETYLFILGPLFFILSLSFVNLINILILTILESFIIPLKKNLLETINFPHSKLVDSIYNKLNEFNNNFYVTRRFTGSIILSIFVMFYIPYQFAYIVCCLAQIIVTIKSYISIDKISKREKQNSRFENLKNYNFSLLMLMIWLIPVNIPVLIVFFHNVAVRWETPFSSHHNILAILPIILLIGRNVQGIFPLNHQNTSQRRITSIILIYFAIFALIYGIRHLYWLHYLLNFLCAWIFILSFW
ncbi:hypothetical protein WICMUC_002837 [Wickerhamomyces mucosus]|uniref:GPI inositol-deacylase n=1 Tax=Wickerhamomyces mucosus TaxID=1378264 RepID=A0A9P8TDW8_9ASCO|nr:hypothetical protein WICMUC_002837 [Wickerhamomyces mucosus]